MRSKPILLPLLHLIAAVLLVQSGSGQNIGIGLPAAAARAQLEVLGSGGLRASSTNPGTGIGDWIAGNFGYSLSGDRVVMGNLQSTATVGAHNNGLTAWSTLFINYAGIGAPVNISVNDTTYLGNTIITPLAGAGTRMLVVNNAGAVSAQAIPAQPAAVTGMNGLISPGNNVQLGGVLSQAITINQSNYSLGFTNGSGGTNLVVQNGRVGVNVASPNYSLEVNGTLAGNAAYINLSDKRFKTNIKPIDNAVQKIMALRGVRFNWNDQLRADKSGAKVIHAGFIAQEVERVLPQAVTTANDALRTKSVAYSAVIPVLVEAIKQQQAQFLRQQQEMLELKRILEQSASKN